VSGVILNPPWVSADKNQDVLVSSTGCELCEVHFQVLKRHGACSLYPRAWLIPLTHIVLHMHNASSTHLGAQAGKLGN
jgi:hypothetical protein